MAVFDLDKREMHYFRGGRHRSGCRPPQNQLQSPSKKERKRTGDQDQCWGYHSRGDTLKRQKFSVL